MQGGEFLSWCYDVTCVGLCLKTHLTIYTRGFEFIGRGHERTRVARRLSGGCICKGERHTERRRDTHRDAQRDTHRRTHRDTQTETHRATHRESQRHTKTEIHRATHTETHTEGHKETTTQRHWVLKLVDGAIARHIRICILKCAA